MATCDIPFGLTEPELHTLVRLVCATADENQLHPDTPDAAYERALRSFSDPAEVDALAVSTWARIEQGQ